MFSDSLSWLRQFLGMPKDASTPSSRTGSTGHADVNGRTIYAIGDIHGRLDLLKSLEQAIAADVARHSAGKDTALVYLGDYIDRGSQSRGVIEHLASRTPLAGQEIFLRGNHEQVLLDFLQTPEVLDSWFQFGGFETLSSYGLRPTLPLTPGLRQALRNGLEAAMPPAHLAFLRQTRPNFETPTHFFVHAGVNPAVPLEQQKPHDMMWIRDEFLTSSRKFPKIIVHGHTPVAKPEKLAQRINVDTGAYITGILTCAVVSGRSCRFLSTKG